MPKEVWIVRGETSGNIDGQPAELAEWQFSDGPAGRRGGSNDYLSLEEGLREHTGCVLHWDPSND